MVTSHRFGLQFIEILGFGVSYSDTHMPRFDAVAV